MRKGVVFFFSLCLLGMVGLTVIEGCKKETSPTDATNTSLNRGTPTPAPISGPLEVDVTDNYLTYPTPVASPVLNSLPVTGITVLAIPPSNSVTYTKQTQPDGKAYFQPNPLEVGNWTLVVPQQAGYPFAKSVVTAPVSVAYETIPIYSAPSTLMISAVGPQVLTSSLGGTIVADVTYNQTGNLLVPIGLSLPSLPSNWVAKSGATSFGFVTSDVIPVTFFATPCVDHAVTYSVTGSDFEPTPVVRALSAPASITKSYTSYASCSWTTNSINNGFCSDGNMVLNFSGTLNFSATNACGSITVHWLSGNCCQQCLSVNGGGCNSSTDCGGGSFTLGPGSYSINLNNDQYIPVIYVTFQGTTYNFDPTYAFSASTQSIFNVSY